MIRIFRFFLLLACCASLGQGLYFFRKGFSLRRLQCLPQSCSYEPSLEIQKIIKQPFYYIGRGRQCFAFASQDGLYVLKCPRTDIYRLPLWARTLPVSAKRDAMIKDKTYRKNFVFNSFRIAKEILPEETGTLAIHLGESAKTDQKITLVDALGVSFHLPLYKTIFILQHKHPLWTPLFLDAQKKGDVREQERLLEALIDIISERAKKGILNRDRSFLRNYGFDGKQAHQIDVGDFFEKTTWDRHIVFHKSVEDSLTPVKEWLEENHKEMLPFFEKRFSQLFASTPSS